MENVVKDCWNCKRAYDGSPKPCVFAISCHPATFGIFGAKSSINLSWIASMPKFEDK